MTKPASPTSRPTAKTQSIASGCRTTAIATATRSSRVILSPTCSSVRRPVGPRAGRLQPHRLCHRRRRHRAAAQWRVSNPRCSASRCRPSSDLFKSHLKRWSVRPSRVLKPDLSALNGNLVACARPIEWGMSMASCDTIRYTWIPALLKARMIQREDVFVTTRPGDEQSPRDERGQVIYDLEGT
jgi:hypothetical protein